jgi:hypothetical protein
LKDGAYNLGCTLSAGIFKLTAANGTDLSEYNVGWVVMNSTTAGLKTRLRVTSATHLFEDDSGTSDIAGEEFGVTSGVSWSVDRPFFIYGVNADNTAANLKFGISPRPNMQVSPATASIGYHTVPMSTPSDSGIFMMTATDVRSTHDAKPVLRIGAIRMRKVTSDDWTVQTLGQQDGIGKEEAACNVTYTMPNGQMGAAANTIFFANGGTAPVYDTQNLQEYKLSLDGSVNYRVGQTNAAATNGSGAVTLRVALPYLSVNDGAVIYGGGSGYLVNNVSLNTNIVMRVIYNSKIAEAQYQSTIGTAVSLIQNADQNQNNRQIGFDLRYQAF